MTQSAKKHILHISDFTKYLDKLLVSFIFMFIWWNVRRLLFKTILLYVLCTCIHVHICVHIYRGLGMHEKTRGPLVSSSTTLCLIFLR